MSQHLGGIINCTWTWHFTKLHTSSMNGLIFNVLNTVMVSQSTAALTKHFILSWLNTDLEASGLRLGAAWSCSLRALILHAVSSHSRERENSCISSYKGTFLSWEPYPHDLIYNYHLKTQSPNIFTMIVRTLSCEF
jgi:hypothetical protein